MRPDGVRLSGPVVRLIQYRGARLEFQQEPLWELVEVVGQRMGVYTHWENLDDLRPVTAELEPIQQAILNAVEGIVDEFIYGLLRYVETGEQNEASQYVADCLRVIRMREEEKKRLTV